MLREAMLLSAVLAGVLCGSAAAYELYLDIDLDGDPATINDLCWDQSCTVRLVLAPTEPDEEIWTVDFGLGGSCQECGGVFAYGTAFDLGEMQSWTWETHPWFAGTWGYATSIDCPAPTGYHALYHAELIVDCCLVLNEPIFFAAFEAWAVDNGPLCSVPANLAVMHGQGAANVWHYVQIGGPAVAGDKRAWGAVKSSYR
ncbi:MAG: hypothetical protein IH621_02395 [Krumholzibacteria bacterium]|nr:hypothetical protein [Candidatus Krumholzibacteria bacterium]